MDEKPMQQFKVVILGDSGVGKSQLVFHFVNDRPCDRPILVTLGHAFSSKELEIEPGVRVNLDLWDTCGLERFRTLIPGYVCGTDGVLLLFDLTNSVIQSFEHIKDVWYPLVPERCQRVLVGHKSDCENRCVSREEAEKLATDLGLPYVETSSVTGHNVKVAFEMLARQMYKEMQRREQQQSDSKGDQSVSWSCVLS